MTVDSLDECLSKRSDRALRLAEGAIVGGTALGFALSYSALRRLAAAHGYDAWEAATWPLAVDFVAVACTALAMALAKRRHGPTGETWAVAGAAALVSLSGNVVSASTSVRTSARKSTRSPRSPCACPSGPPSLSSRPRGRAHPSAERAIPERRYERSSRPPMRAASV
jgi:hypothetical protein